MALNAFVTESADLNVGAWSFDPALASTGTAVTGGTIYLASVYWRADDPAADLPGSVLTAVTVAGSGTSTGSFAGVYNAQAIPGTSGNIVAGTRLAVTAELGTAISATIHADALTWTGVSKLPSGQYWVAYMANQSVTLPTLAQSPGSTTPALAQNLGTGTATMRFAVNGTGATALPATITVASNSATNARALLVGLQ